MSDKISEEEFARRKQITKNWKYKYLSDLKQLRKNWFDPRFDLYKAYVDSKKITGIRLGVTNSAEDDCYIMPGVNIIAGLTGHGKSMVANTIAYREVKNGKNVLFISLEIVKRNIYYQMLSIHSFATRNENEYISHSTIKKHQLSGEQEAFVFDTLWKEFNNLDGNLFILDEWDFDTSSSEQLQEQLFLVEEYAQTTTGHGLDLIIVDYIQLLKTYSDTGITKEYDSLNMWTNDFRRISCNFLGQNHEIPIVLLSQLNRDAMNDEIEIAKKVNKNKCLPAGKQKAVPDIKLGLSQIAGCIEICKAATTIFAIYSNESLKVSNQCWFFMLKNRDGACNEEPKISYMNPKYYSVGQFENWNVEYQGIIDFDNLVSPTL